MRLAVEEQDTPGESPFPLLKRAEPPNGLGKRNRRKSDGRVCARERLDACHAGFVESEGQGEIHLEFIEQLEDFVGVGLRIPEILAVNRDSVP